MLGPSGHFPSCFDPSKTSPRRQPGASRHPLPSCRSPHPFDPKIRGRVPPRPPAPGTCSCRACPDGRIPRSHADPGDGRRSRCRALSVDPRGAASRDVHRVVHRAGDKPREVAFGDAARACRHAPHRFPATPRSVAALGSVGPRVSPGPRGRARVVSIVGSSASPEQAPGPSSRRRRVLGEQPRCSSVSDPARGGIEGSSRSSPGLPLRRPLGPLGCSPGSNGR
jgi:hypothetical protein